MNYQTQRVLEIREQRVQREHEWQTSAEILQKAHALGVKTPLERLAELGLLVQLPMEFSEESVIAGSE